MTRFDYLVSDIATLGIGLIMIIVTLAALREAGRRRQKGENNDK